MKLLSIAVPCYNSEAYMENCIKSLLVGGDEVEILIVDDGSGDGTAQIADRLEREHPGIVRAIHQPNKGHGGAVNTGIENATGLYFKVVDSDDKVRASAYKSILDVLRRFSGEEEPLSSMCCAVSPVRKNPWIFLSATLSITKKTRTVTKSWNTDTAFPWDAFFRGMRQTASRSANTFSCIRSSSGHRCCATAA